MSRATGAAITLDVETFANLCGRLDDGEDVLLFKVARQVMEADYGQWSPPVQFRFVKDDGAFVSLEMRSL